jgi:hypothetical protein
MPKLVSELAQGNSFSRSSDGGALADSATRVFKIILNEPNEALDIFSAIGVTIGDVYSASNPIPCVSVEGRADGESRLVRIVTAQYRSSPGVGSSGGGGGGGGDPRATAPDLRFASFSVSTSYMEMPAYSWYEYTRATVITEIPWLPPGAGPFGAENKALRVENSTIASERTAAANPNKDIYDGVSRYEPVVNFSFRQFEIADPTWKLHLVGMVNGNQGSFGSLNLFPRSTLFKACNIEQHVESWGGTLYRGYMVSYEFAYRKNFQHITINLLGFPPAPAEPDHDVAIGWDIAMPQTGFNVKTYVPPAANLLDADKRDVFGQPLKHGKEGTEYYGKIEEPLSLPEGVDAGEIHRAMVKVFSYQGGGASQTPSAQPVLLDDSGHPRKHTLFPIINRFGVHDHFNFGALNLRLPPF